MKCSRSDGNPRHEDSYIALALEADKGCALAEANPIQPVRYAERWGVCSQYDPEQFARGDIMFRPKSGPSYWVAIV